MRFALMPSASAALAVNLIFTHALGRVVPEMSKPERNFLPAIPAAVTTKESSRACLNLKILEIQRETRKPTF